MSRNALKLAAAVSALLAVIAVDPTDYGAADRLARDLAALDADTPRGWLEPVPVDALRELPGIPGRYGVDDLALDIHPHHHHEEKTNEPIPTRTAANPR